MPPKQPPKQPMCPARHQSYDLLDPDLPSPVTELPFPCATDHVQRAREAHRLLTIYIDQTQVLIEKVVQRVHEKGTASVAGNDIFRANLLHLYARADGVANNGCGRLYPLIAGYNIELDDTLCDARNALDYARYELWNFIDEHSLGRQEAVPLSSGLDRPLDAAAKQCQARAESTRGYDKR